MERQKMNTPIAPVVAAAPTIVNNNVVGGGTTVVVNQDTTVNHCQHCEPALAQALKQLTLYPRAPDPRDCSLLDLVLARDRPPRLVRASRVQFAFASGQVGSRFRAGLGRAAAAAARSRAAERGSRALYPIVLLPPVHPPSGRDKTGGNRTECESRGYGRPREVVMGDAGVLPVVMNVTMSKGKRWRRLKQIAFTTGYSSGWALWPRYRATQQG